MSVGHPTSKAEIDAYAGDIARAFQRGFNNVATMQSYLQQTPDPDLIAMGYTANDVAVLKTSFADLAQLTSIWLGQAALPAAKDFRTFVRQLWGVGSF